MEAVERGLSRALDRAGADLAIDLVGVDPTSGDRPRRLAVSKAGLAERDRLMFA